MEHFLRKTSGDAKKISPDAMKQLMDYVWNGNVRELENVIERMALLSDKDELTPADLPAEITGYVGDMKAVPELSGEGVDVDKIIGDIEKKYLLKALEKAGGVKTEAAKLLNLSFRSFRHRLHKYGIN